ncbi:hypothetical protein INT46_007972 [Mucor plumbeus]|uniref:Uncharacterized protein n=1 Tax=Mucor plumbeus TaxID=97098 RepID=A0A8H7RJM6_9FUNG|nr:hypothetical protein INT46_007972 [Mucor plumbeus]
MQPNKKLKKMRVSGLKKNYRYKEWLDAVLNDSKPSLDYFKFANTFKGKEAATNSHYVDLLQTLSKNQSNKLMKIASEAQTLFEKRNNTNEEFGKRYIMHWEQNVDQINLRRRLRAQNHNTIERLNQITNEQIVRQAEQVRATFIL